MNNERKIRIFDDSWKNWVLGDEVDILGVVIVDNAACSSVVFIDFSWVFEACVNQNLLRNY